MQNQLTNYLHSLPAAPSTANLKHSILYLQSCGRTLAKALAQAGTLDDCISEPTLGIRCSKASGRRFTAEVPLDLHFSFRLIAVAFEWITVKSEEGGSNAP